MIFTKEEWRDMTRHLWPEGYVDADFDQDWLEFSKMKYLKALH